MHERQTQTFHTLMGGLLFFDQTSLDPEPPLLAGKRTQLKETINRIDELAQVQTATSRNTSGKLDGRRRELREKRMLPLKSIAKGQLLFAPGADAALRVPHARASAQVVAAAALRMTNALMPHVKLLAAAGVTKDFLRQMNHEARSLALTVKQNAELRRRRVEVTAAIASELKKGLDILAVIEGIVVIHGTPDQVSLWRTVRKRRKKLGRPRTIRKRKSRPPLPS